MQEVVDVLTYEVELVEVEAQPTAVVRGDVRPEEIRAFLGGAFGEVMQVLGAQGMYPAGPPFGCYVPVTDGFTVEAGFPTSAPVTSAGRVVASELPGGLAARVLHRGDYAGVGVAYEAAQAWLATEGYVASGPPWETYLDGPDVAEPRTFVYLPCRR